MKGGARGFLGESRRRLDRSFKEGRADFEREARESFNFTGGFGGEEENQKLFHLRKRGTRNGLGTSQREIFVRKF